MAKAAGGLPIVCLGRLDAAEPRAASLHVDDDGRQVGACQIRDALAFQRDSGRAGRRHGAGACRGSSVNHVDGGYFAFGLQIRSANFRHSLGHICGELGLGGDGVPEEVSAPGRYGGGSHGLVALHENLVLFCHMYHLHTLIATSGHMVAQFAQPVHLFSSTRRAGWHPLAVMTSWSSSMMP